MHVWTTNKTILIKVASQIYFHDDLDFRNNKVLSLKKRDSPMMIPLSDIDASQAWHFITDILICLSHSWDLGKSGLVDEEYQCTFIMVISLTYYFDIKLGCFGKSIP